MQFSNHHEKISANVLDRDIFPCLEISHQYLILLVLIALAEDHKFLGTDGNPHQYRQLGGRWQQSTTLEFPAEFFFCCSVSAKLKLSRIHSRTWTCTEDDNSA